MALSALYHEKYFGHSSFRSQLQRHQDNSPVPWGWFVLVGPRRRKPVQCIPCLLWYDVIQWRMDHVLHHWWIRETQKWGDVQPWFPLWSGRVQNKLQQYSFYRNHVRWPSDWKQSLFQAKVKPFSKSRSQLWKQCKRSGIVGCRGSLPFILLPTVDLWYFVLLWLHGVWFHWQLWQGVWPLVWWL